MRSTRRRRNTRTNRLIMGVLNMDMGVRVVLLVACIQVMVVNRVVNMARTIRTIRTTMDIIKSITVTHGAEAEADTLTVIRC